MVRIDYTASHKFPINKKNMKKIRADTDLSVEEIHYIIDNGVRESADTRRDKSLFSVLAIFGCRTSELLNVRKKDIVVYKKQIGDVLEIDYICIEFSTLKNPTQPRRRVPIKYGLYAPLLDLLLSYIKQFSEEGGEETDLLFPITRVWVWYLCKAYFGREYSPHWWRHLSASRDARSGFSSTLLKKKYGWAKIESSTPYINLNSADVLDFQNKLLENKAGSKVFGVGVGEEYSLSKQPPKQKEVFVPIKKVVEVKKKEKTDSGIVF